MPHFVISVGLQIIFAVLATAVLVFLTRKSMNIMKNQSFTQIIQYKEIIL